MKNNKSDMKYILKNAQKIKAIKLLGGKCSNCNREDYCCLEFHHEKEKENSITDILSCRWSEIEKEVKKCILLCRNCHMELHYPNASKKKMEILKIMDKMVICEKCGYNKNYSALDFHHIDLSTKKFSFRDVHNGHMFLKPLKNIIEEMNKCELLCKNCHAKEHFDTNRFLKFKKEIFNKVNSYVEHSPVNWDIVKTMHKQGIKKADISREIGCSKGLITHILKKGKIK